MQGKGDTPIFEKQLAAVRAERQESIDARKRLEESREFCEAAFRQANDWNERFRDSAPIATATAATRLQERWAEGRKKAAAQYEEADDNIRRLMANLDTREEEILQSRKTAGDREGKGV